MKRNMRKNGCGIAATGLAAAICLTTLQGLAAANTPWIKGATDKDPLTYRCGEKIAFTLTLERAETLPSGLDIVWTRTGDDGRQETGKVPADPSKPLTVETTLDRPGFVRLYAILRDSNGKVWAPEGVKVKNLDGREITVTQTGTQFNNVGKLVITPDGRFITELVKSKENNFENAKVSAVTNDIKQKVQEVTSEKVAHTDYTLVVSDENDQWIVRGLETNAGDLVADAYRYALKADIGMENGGGIRNDINAGDITYGDIIGMLPYDNTLRRIMVSAEQLQAMLTRCTALVPVLDGNFPQVSGLRFTIHSKSHTVSDIEIQQEDGSYAPIDMQRTYSVALTNYNHDNGGFFDCFKKCVVLEESALRYYEALSDYLKTVLGGTTGTAYAQPQGRIKIVED